MHKEPPTIDLSSSVGDKHRNAGAEVPALVIAWSAEEPQRIGEVAIFEMPGSARILGRGDEGSGTARVSFSRRTPGERSLSQAVAGSGISREQLRITATRTGLDVERLGRCSMVFRGEKVEHCHLSPGDTLLLKGQLLLLCVMRPVQMTVRDYPPTLRETFGEPCRLGLLGESAALWALRDSIAFYAKAGGHALVLGPSGAGKELVARAIHRLSSRAEGPFVARNAATLPVGLAEAELFGNVKNYPNPGMAERPGLVGAAEGGTLFLDELGELPEALHASLLRVLDGDGEYHRLGEAKARRANLRFVGATNRSAETLKHDLLARLPLRLPVSGLEERLDDIPLLARHLLRRARDTSPELLARFTGADGEVRLSSDLVDHLLHKSYTTHVRELDGALWRAMAGSPGKRIDLPEDMAAEALASATEADAPESSEASGPTAPRRAPAEEPSLDGIRAAVAEHGGNLVQAAKALGLPSRYALYRLLRKHGINAANLRPEGD